MIANILGVLAAGGAILALPDIFVSDRIKGWLSQIVTVVWSHLDDLLEALGGGSRKEVRRNVARGRHLWESVEPVLAGTAAVLY
jgi:hypothetical protein